MFSYSLSAVSIFPYLEASPSCAMEWSFFFTFLSKRYFLCDVAMYLTSNYIWIGTLFGVGNDLEICLLSFRLTFIFFFWVWLLGSCCWQLTAFQLMQLLALGDNKQHISILYRYFACFILQHGMAVWKESLYCHRIYPHMSRCLRLLSDYPFIDHYDSQLQAWSQ